MLGDIVTAALTGPDMQVVGVLPDRVPGLQTARLPQVDVVVLGTAADEKLSDSAFPASLQPRICLIRLSADGRRAVFDLPEVSPDDLAAVIRVLAATRVARH